MNKNSELKKLFYIYSILDFTLIICSIFVGLNFFLNSQISFLCSLIILSLNIYVYKKRVLKDSLYGDDLSLNPKKPKKIVFQKITTFLSPFKIFGYILLIVGFFFLRNSDRFEIIPFLLGILLMPLGIIIFAFRLKLYDNLADNTH
ncbi:hypothetical protein CSPB12327_01620 [Campylobacter sp. RM12327]|uniref:hypothetical protein n=1 Tax=Campylobacter sputorum TaxID=206 RepID=UPI000B788BBD|nr:MULTISPECIES: hypothetical protein [Campylobacter]ASM39756.1 putative membrane protein [Campylobacter sputorum]MBF6668854.1 hypothetical protein [Campylobacter sp. RM12327]MBF6673768.1 hypothetical protein [Campylobacter sp. RM13538]MBF6676217.1 hypothetical protein [Campylobacter sp. RM12321]MBF6678152.1 hypothetical protein [Campylobacter sp. RM11259]